MNNDEIIIAASKELDIVIDKSNHSNLSRVLAERINEMINNDFQRLISILYRIDVSELKLQQILNANRGVDAGSIIADLIIERQKEKIKTRQQFNKKDPGISDEEKW